MRRAVATLGLLLMTSLLPSAEPLATGVQARRFVSAIDQTEQPYNLYVPTTYKPGTPTPLVVALHGKGATWQSWFAALPVEEWAEREGFILATPEGRGSWFYLGPGEKDVFEVMADVKSLCSIDEDRTYLMGHSMGGFGTWHLAASHPDVFAAIVPMATWAPVKLLPSLKHTPVMLVHGDADLVVPIEWGRRAQHQLEALGIEHRWLVAPGIGHESELITGYLRPAAEFLRTKRRVKDPESVSVRAYTPRRGKAWWVSLQEVEEFTELASIDASITPRRIEVVTSNVVDLALDPPLSEERLALPIRLSVDNQLVDVPATRGERIIFLRKVEGRWGARLADRSTFGAPAPKPVGERPAEAPSVVETVARIVAARVEADAMLVPNDLVAPAIPTGKVDEDQLLDIFMRPEDEVRIVELSAEQATELLVDKEWYPAWWGGLTLAPKPSSDSVVLAVPRILADRMPVKTVGTGLSVRRIVVDHVRETGRLMPPE